MNVKLIARTHFENQPELGRLDPPTHADALAEFAGRACYQSWDRPNPKTARNDLYLENILLQQHFSVLEHATATFYIEGISRSLTHELVRHRHFSYSQLSQRFVDESNVEFVMPPAIRNAEDVNLNGFDEFRDMVLEAYTDLVEQLQKKGLPRKQAREAARAVLPNMTETKIVVTGNHRAWREFLSKRLSPGADAEIQILAIEILRQLKELAPSTYQDM